MIFLRQKKLLPDFFRPILWSYDFAAIESERHKKVIIVNTINYGNLRHWQWLILNYGKKAIADILERIPSTELRPAARRLSSVVFHINHFNNVSRSVKR